MGGLDIGRVDEFIVAVIDQGLGRAVRCFQVKLKCEHAMAYRERLILTSPALGEVRRAIGQVKRVAVPVKNIASSRE